MCQELKNAIMMAAILFFVAACSVKIKLGMDHWERYVCSTGMLMIDQNVLWQQYSLNLGEEHMRVKLRQTRPGDPSLETFSYADITGGTIKAVNSAGVIATFSIQTLELVMRMSDTGPEIRGKCVVQSK